MLLLPHALVLQNRRAYRQMLFEAPGANQVSRQRYSSAYSNALACRAAIRLLAGVACTSLKLLSM